MHSSSRSRSRSTACGQGMDSLHWRRAEEAASLCAEVRRSMMDDRRELQLALALHRRRRSREAQGQTFCASKGWKVSNSELFARPHPRTRAAVASLPAPLPAPVYPRHTRPAPRQVRPSREVSTSSCSLLAPAPTSHGCQPLFRTANLTRFGVRDEFTNLQPTEPFSRLAS